MRVTDAIPLDVLELTPLTGSHCKLGPNTEGHQHGTHTASTVRGVEHNLALEDAIGSHTCSLEALASV
jgi:hypothetical protein